MKQEVIEFFHSISPASTNIIISSGAEQFNRAFELYRQSPNKNTIAERKYNQAGYTSHNLEMLLYDLQKLHDITDIEKIPVLDSVRKLEPTAVDKVKVFIIGSGDPLPLMALKLLTEYPILHLPDTISPELAYYVGQSASALNSACDQFSGTVNPFDEEKLKELIEACKVEIAEAVLPEEILSELQQLNTNLPIQPTTDATFQQADATSLRAQYPFLNDPDCPDELKILVADKLTHYYAHKDCLTKLEEFKNGTITLTPEEEKKMAADSIYHFDQNELIIAELDHYATEKQLLGKHSIFVKLALQREVDEMTQDELLKFKVQTPSYISKKNTDLKKANITEERKLVLEAAIKDRTDKLALVNKKLGVAS